jgi:surface carbohydrate biosynthesis protein (TIGR04326 family)
MSINNIPLEILFEREMWQEFKLMVFNLNLMFYYGMSNFFSKGWCKVLVYTFENQPFEKMICMAKDVCPNIKLIGYRNSHSPWFYLSLFLGEKEYEFIPLPDKIITMGNHALRMFREKGGYEDRILRNGGAWRYTYLWERDFQIDKDNASKTVLVATPIDPLIAKTLLLDLKRAFYNTNTDIKFLIKCHPSTPFSLLKIEMHNNDLFQIVDYPIEQLFDTVGTVIYTTSTVGVEALVKGKKVIRFIPNNLITADPLDGIASNLYFTCYEGDCFEIILKALQSDITEKTKTEIMQLKYEYFDKVNYDLWLREVTTDN